MSRKRTAVAFYQYAIKTKLKKIDFQMYCCHTVKVAFPQLLSMVATSNNIDWRIETNSEFSFLNSISITQKLLLTCQVA